MTAQRVNPHRGYQVDCHRVDGEVSLPQVIFQVSANKAVKSHKFAWLTFNMTLAV